MLRALCLLLLLTPLASCIASTDYVEERVRALDVKQDAATTATEDRVDAVDEKATMAIDAMAGALEAKNPGLRAYIRGVLERFAINERRKLEVLPAPPAQAMGEANSWAWLGEIGGPIGIAVGAIIAAIAGAQQVKKSAVAEAAKNENERRVAQGEAVTVPQAIRKGYFSDELRAPKFDPRTGAPLAPPAFDPQTGLPLQPATPEVPA